MSGAYQLVLFLERSGAIRIGALGVIDFKRGYYVYTGSAQRALEHRIARHLRRKKKIHWHIDHLTSRTDIAVREVRIILSNERHECQIHRRTLTHHRHSRIVNGFGAGDCTNGCGSHLIFVGRKKPELILPD